MNLSQQFHVTLVFHFLILYLSQAQGQACTCDLTQNGCDPNCCCDLDCSVQDKDAFTFCKNVDLNKDDRVCVSRQVIAIDNVNYRTEGTADGLFCIYADNYPKRNFYTTVQTAETEASFTTLANKYKGNSFQITPPVVKTKYTSSSKYKVGDQVLLIFQSNIQGYLSLPKPAVGTSECDDENPAGFLQSGTSKCSRIVSDLASQCSSNSAFSALSYFSGFKFAPAPSFFADVITFKEVNLTASNSTVAMMTISPTPAVSASVASTVATDMSNVTSNVTSNTTNSTNTTSTTRTLIIINKPTYADTSLLNVTVQKPLLCKSQTGVIGSCSFVDPPRPSYDFTSNTCKNIVLKVTYTITYQTNATLAISSAVVSFIFGDVKSTVASFQQEFSVTFQKEGSGDAFKRSGNPGYITGQPVLAGTLVTNQQQKKQSIQLNTDPTKWLTLIRPKVDRTCGDSSEKIPITFGINMRTGCIIRVKQTMTTQECKVLQEIIYNTLIGSLPTYVAMFGNSAVTNTADWVKVINTRPTTNPSSSNGQCSNMILGVHLEVLHSKTGYLGNPQQRIVGVQVKYDNAKEIIFQCTGSYCLPGSSALAQPVEVVQSVAFTDVSTTPAAQIKPKPAFESKAPYDFFYPFV